MVFVILRKLTKSAPRRGRYSGASLDLLQAAAVKVARRQSRMGRERTRAPGSCSEKTRPYARPPHGRTNSKAIPNDPPISGVRKSSFGLPVRSDLCSIFCASQAIARQLVSETP